jgi:hypothetical protein
MFLDYFALFLLCLSITAVFYGVISIHDLPHKIAKAREHPQRDGLLVHYGKDQPPQQFTLVRIEQPEGGQPPAGK